MVLKWTRQANPSTTRHISQEHTHCIPMSFGLLVTSIRHSTTKGGSHGWHHSINRASRHILLPRFHDSALPNIEDEVWPFKLRMPSKYTCYFHSKSRHIISHNGSQWCRSRLYIFRSYDTYLWRQNIGSQVHYWKSMIMLAWIGRYLSQFWFERIQLAAMSLANCIADRDKNKVWRNLVLHLDEILRCRMRKWCTSLLHS